MPVLSEDPRSIHPACKEAVVDSLLNGLSARLAGRGEFYQFIYGTKPVKALLSEFIVPMPAEEREGDEEADPVRISAHGMDFQIISSAGDARLTVSLNGALYLRILPDRDDISPDGPLAPIFPLTREARTTLREALTQLAQTLPGGKSDPEWSSRSEEVRRRIYTSMLPASESRVAEGAESGDTGDTGDTGENIQLGAEAHAGITVPDALVDDIPPPAKWVRVPLNLPDAEFSPNTAVSDALIATDALNEAIASQLADWAASTDAESGGMLWGYRRSRIRPSDVNDWDNYLERVRHSGLPIVVPQIELRWVFQVTPDPLDSSRVTLHIALENWSQPLTTHNFKEVEPSLFHVSVITRLPENLHRPLRLDRVKPSYRYNQYLSYAALGFNGGVIPEYAGETLRLKTTWAPRYVLPRVIPASTGVELKFTSLSQPDSLSGLASLIPAYENWLQDVRVHSDVASSGSYTPEQADAEHLKFQHDCDAWQAELAAIRCGLNILTQSREHWSGPGVQSSSMGIPFEAWLSMNKAMAKVAASKGYTEWRLFQLAFILASIPAFATRLPAFHSLYTPEVARHANAVTLLYFSTGGGKSEAFLGLLTFVLFFDRLRGKHHGVSALMRYPLRLLTLQQARRTFATIGAAEEIRHKRGHPGEPFSLGFWVGSSNSPNWHSEDGYNDVPVDSSVAPSQEATYRLTQPYKSARERWLKLSSCPFCGSKAGKLLALRRHSGNGANALGHYCCTPKEKCSWNGRFSQPTPLPFYIVDEDIYALAPSVLLGTVDKLAVLGQSQGTLRRFFGMFGFAPLLKNNSQRLCIPMKRSEWDDQPGPEARALFPAFASGEKRFFDPFPSLLIQDEAHLLDESLGTFSGLFESALEAAFDTLSPLLQDSLAREPGTSLRRKIKVIAASATVSEPERQMRNLYQRDHTVQFPYPGPSLYGSFYAIPQQPDGSDADVERAKLDLANTELRSHWGRVYSSVLTNGHRHTVAMASVLGHYHLMITGLYERLRSEDTARQEEARQELLSWVSPGPLQVQFVRLLTQASAATLLTLVDLHRISLTYVTNKKGGDQVIDTERVQFAKLHQSKGYPNHYLNSELISGAVSAADIQDIVRRAETRVDVNAPFPALNDTLRSVIATSAISHGVDVEEFNAMFFAGIPSDIAEYIQASSRVGRTHVGFSLLVPVPQRYRDRFVLEIHDIFHRFLERMILPAAVDRWAEKALVRVIPSFFQEYICGVSAIEQLCSLPADQKRNSPLYSMAHEVRHFLTDPANVSATEAFLEKALGLNASAPPEGKHYYQSLLKAQLTHIRQDLENDRLVNGTHLGSFLTLRNSLLRPMTSLRDVDLPGIIHESRTDASSRRVAEGITERVMTFIRRGSGADIDSTDAE